MTQPRGPMSVAQLIAALAAILVATAVIPPAAAWLLNAGRISQTSRRASAALDRLGAASAVEGFPTGTGVVCGPGRLPSAREEGLYPAHVTWLREIKSAPELFGPGMPTDAWGRCFVMNIGNWPSGGPVWLLSAGPNGVMDTPPNALLSGGDDIGGRLR